MKHKHYEMIVAKAANPELVQFYYTGGSWFECGFDDRQITFHESSAYFLCLPEHKEACLHWLNGGEIQYKRPSIAVWSVESQVVGNWFDTCGLMNEECEYRIKPCKEKRWIACNVENGNVYGMFSSKTECIAAWPALQIIEIEVEV